MQDVAAQYVALRQRLINKPACINREPHRAQMLADEVDLQLLRGATYFSDGISVELTNGQQIQRNGHWKQAWESLQ